ncbi:Somatic embryogenesis receptor kinase 4 [Acorus calamus]|uniref:Somatic embryogenesis receptor kinase 4 n=1 Tax=Acorus calamus TaxID=4465 RepID=A0AAV9C1H8_ACOCL|nr:Somatic embryogenesis receptor kinase 4 [Acorus calamus]
MDCLRRRVRSFLSNTKKAAAREDQNGEARLLAQLKRFGRESNPIMIFTLRDILLMTNNFSDTNLVDDSTASLYKGSTLGGCPIVVRKPNSDREEGSSEQFQAFAEIALRCTRGKGERPEMKEVVLELRRIKRL